MVDEKKRVSDAEFADLTKWLCGRSRCLNLMYCPKCKAFECRLGHPLVEDKCVDFVAVLSCPFVDGVLCPYRKTVRFSMMNRCWECCHFKRFNREMDEEDEAMDDFCEWAHSHPDAYLRGEVPP